MHKINSISKVILILVVLIALMTHDASADIAVYDDDNQYLGILLNMTDFDITVYIPSLSLSYPISLVKFMDPPGCVEPTTVYFESNDCTGTPYGNSPFPVVIDMTCKRDNYYTPELSGLKSIIFKSRFYYGGECEQVNPDNEEATLYPFKKIELPFSEPIALPLKFKIGTKTVVIPLY